MKAYDTVTGALQDLKLRGFTIDFNIAFDKIICSKNETILNPHEFEIVEVYRFEGDSNPDDEIKRQYDQCIRHVCCNCIYRNAAKTFYTQIIFTFTLQKKLIAMPAAFNRRNFIKTSAPTVAPSTPTNSINAFSSS